jgi:hypothetical protein
MAVSSQDILNFLLANPNMSDSAIAAAMDMYGVTPAMMAEAVGIPVQQVQQRYEEVQPQGLFTAPTKALEPVYTPEPSPEPVYTPEPVYSEPAYVAPEPVAQTVNQPVITPEPQTTQEATTMAVTSKQIIDFLLANPNMTDAQIVGAMEQYGVSPAQMAQAVGLPEGQVAARVGAVLPPNETKLLGDTYVQAVNKVTGSGETQEVGGLENVITYKANENKVGGNVTYYTPEGEYQQTTKQQEVNATKDFLKFAAITGAGLYGLGALGGAGTTFAGEALADASLLSGGGGTALGSTLGGTTFAGEALADAGLLSGGGGLTSGALTAGGAGALTTGGAGSTLMGGAGGLTAGAGGVTGLTTAGAGGLGALGTGGGLTTAGLTAGGLAGANTLLGGSALGSTLGALSTGVAGSTLGSTLGALGAGGTLLGTAATGLGVNNLANLFSGGLGTAGSLLQMQQSKEAALAAQQRIDAETAAAKQAAQFRPIGMTTRFGTSQFQVDPVTGQLTSAGYTLSPEAKNAQDRLVKLAESGLVQAEGAQAQFAPLQTGAQSLFGLGNKYLAQNPQDVAQNYLNQQMQLLQPGRELELANLQNRLQQQGRGGLSVAQGGTLGATTPELQALYNARAMQEAQLAAQAQQAGQQQVTFGAGLLGQGSQAMGQYYGGQQAAYTPYTTALGQVQGLETAAQQPFTMGTNLAQQTSTAGTNVGKLGLTGAQLSTNLATSANATANPYAQALMAAGNPNAMFGQALGNVFGGLFS